MAWPGWGEDNHGLAQHHKVCHCGECSCGRKIVKRQGQNGSCVVERGGYEESGAVRNGLMWVTYLPPRAMVIPGPELQPRAMCRPVTLLLQTESVAVHVSC